MDFCTRSEEKILFGGEIIQGRVSYRFSTTDFKIHSFVTSVLFCSVYNLHYPSILANFKEVMLKLGYASHLPFDVNIRNENSCPNNLFFRGLDEAWTR